MIKILSFSGRGRGQKRAIYVNNSPLERTVIDIFFRCGDVYGRREKGKEIQAKAVLSK